MSYTPATKMPNLYTFQWGTATAPNPTLLNSLSIGETTAYFSHPPLDHAGNVITGGFLMGVKNKDSYVETMWVAPGTVAADGLSATVVRGIRLEGTDYTVGDSSLEANFSAGDPIFCNISAVIQGLNSGVLKGTIATGGTEFTIGTEAGSGGETITLNRTTTAGTKKGVFRWSTLSGKAEYSNDGSTWATIDSISSSDLVVVSGADTTPGNLDDKISVSGLVGKSITSPGGNEKENLDVPIASQAEAEAGTSDVKAMTPLKTKAATGQRALTLGGTVTANDLVKFSSGSTVTIDETAVNFLETDKAVPSLSSLNVFGRCVIDNTRRPRRIGVHEGTYSANHYVMPFSISGGGKVTTGTATNSNGYAALLPVLNPVSGNFITFSSRDANFFHISAHTISDSLVTTSGSYVDPFTTNATNYYTSGWDAGQNAGLVICKNNSTGNNNEVVFTESGRTITAGAVTTTCPIAGSNYTMDMCYDSTNQKMIVVGVGYATVATVVASTRTVSFSALSAAVNGAGSVRTMMVAYSPTLDRILTVYFRYNTGLWCRTGHVSGGVVVWDSAELQINASLNDPVSLVWSNKLNAWLVGDYAGTGTYLIRKASGSETISVTLTTSTLTRIFAEITNEPFDVLAGSTTNDICTGAFTANDMNSYAGIAKESGTVGQTKLIQLKGGILSGLTGGIAGAKYYRGGVEVGQWVSSTEVNLYDNPVV